MKPEDIQSLDTIVGAMKRLGVLHYKGNGVEVLLGQGHLPAPPSLKSEFDAGRFAGKELSDDDLLFAATEGIPMPQKAGA